MQVLGWGIRRLYDGLWWRELGGDMTPMEDAI